jgi:YVTN family beta-propeller protein
VRVRTAALLTTRLGLVALLPLIIVASSTRAEAQTKAKTFVAHAGANVVSVIDPSNDAVTSLDPGAAGPVRVVITGDGTRAYVADGDSNLISVIDIDPDPATDAVAVAGTIEVGANPSALAVSPDGAKLYVMVASGDVQVVDTAQRRVVDSFTLGTSGSIAITPDGTHLYVAAGLVYVIDIAQRTIHSFAAEKASVDGISNTAWSVAISPDGTRAYIGVITFDFTGLNFSAGGSLVLVDTASESVADAINLFSLPGSIALTPDGSRAYVGVQSYWVDTLYGAGFFPGRHLLVIDTITKTIGGLIDLGAASASYTEQNTPSGIGVTPDRRSIYIAVPRLGQVAVADVNTNAVSRVIPVAASPGDLAIVPSLTTAPAPYVSNAVDDIGAAMTTVGGIAVANVLDNDTTGGIAATVKHVTLTALSSTSENLALDTATGTVSVAHGIAAGTHTLGYRICDIATLSSCDDATVTVAVRAPFVLDAVSDTAESFPGRSVLASVLANDTLDGTPVTNATVTLSAVSTTSSGILLNTWSGSVFVLVGTPPGTQTLTYRVCEIASPTNCDDADVTITVKAFPIDAVNDAVSAARSGGPAGSVLANDMFADALATVATVRLSQLSSTDAGVSLDVATGVVNVAAGTAVGTYTVGYRICEIATPSNCDDATVTVTVQPLQITAVGDSGRGSSKSANTVIANVLANDWLGNARATTANVSLSLVSISPANKMIALDVKDGSIDVLGKASSGLFQVVYEICEIAMPSNCARATAKVDLSGGGGGR